MYLRKNKFFNYRNDFFTILNLKKTFGERAVILIDLPKECGRFSSRCGLMHEEVEHECMKLIKLIRLLACFVNF